MGIRCNGNAKIVVVKHKYNNGYVYSSYVHLSSYANIRVGQFVTKDTLIGYMGNTGCSTGPHLHLEVASCFWKNNGGVTHNDDPNYFEDVRKYIDLIDQSTMFEVILSDIERLFKDPESKEAVAISRVRTYIKKKESELKGDTEGNESLTALLKDLM